MFNVTNSITSVSTTRVNITRGIIQNLGERCEERGRRKLKIRQGKEKCKMGETSKKLVSIIATSLLITMVGLIVWEIVQILRSNSNIVGLILNITVGVVVSSILLMYIYGIFLESLYEI